MPLFNQPPQDYRILFLDMDAFFASCEQQLRPALRGKPIGVVPQIVDSTCVLSPSYEAKRLGIKTGTGVREARFICPSMQFVEARPHIYKDIHYQIVDILHEVSPWVDAKSIDEFALIMSPSEQNADTAHTIALQIKQGISTVVGPYTTASIGFASNQFLAKVASELEKPNGLVMITEANRQDMLSALKLTDLPGIARGMSRRLQAESIYTVAELLAATRQDLRRIFGFLGEVWWLRLHGYEVDLPAVALAKAGDVATSRASIGHSHVLAPAWRMPDKASQVLQRLVHKAGQRLRREGYMATYTSLLVKYVHEGHYYHYIRTHPYSDSPTATKLAEQLFTNRPMHLAPILHLAFTFSGLVPMNGRPMSLFPEIERPLRLTDALDTINDKFGRDTIFVGSMLRSAGEAPDRIPFGRLRY